MTVNELRTFAGLDLEENATAQYRSSRIISDNSQVAALSKKNLTNCAIHSWKMIQLP